MNFDDTITNIELNDDGTLKSIGGNFIVKQLRKPTLYTAIFDEGKPYSIVFEDLDELKEELIKFYYRNKDEGYDYDCKVYNHLGDDISESQFIQDMIEDIIREDD